MFEETSVVVKLGLAEGIFLILVTHVGCGDINVLTKFHKNWIINGVFIK